MHCLIGELITACNKTKCNLECEISHASKGHLCVSDWPPPSHPSNGGGGGAGHLAVIQETLDGINVSLLTHLLCIHIVYVYIGFCTTLPHVFKGQMTISSAVCSLHRAT